MVGGGGAVVGGPVVAVTVAVTVVARGLVVLGGVSPPLRAPPSSGRSCTSRAGMVGVDEPSHSTAPMIAATAATAAAMRALRWVTALIILGAGEENRRGR